ncbi:methyltransferase [Fusarium coicis]|nr:methyltransferase [Fusarium coicis]
MPDIDSSDEYVLGRDISGSIRLDAQHLLWRLHTGYTLHPAIPRSSKMKIAEVGTGTGIWLFDLAQELPDTVCLHGYDISATQFPSKELWPPNVNFVSKLLKPGGYIQWEEANLLVQEVRSSSGEEFERKANKLFTVAGIDYSWVSSLKASLESCGMVSIEHLQCRFKPGLIQMCTNTYLMALKEIFDGIKRTSSISGSSEIEACDVLLDKLICSRTDGMVYNWGPVSLLARKPSVEC